MTQAVVRQAETRGRIRPMPAVELAGTGRHRVGYALFVLVNATLFIRPADIIPALENWNIYLWLILACAAASLPVILKQLQWSYLSRNPGVLCVVLLVPAVFVSHISHGNLYSARTGALDFSKIVLYFLLLVGLVDSRPRLRGFLTLTTLFIAVTALLAILNYHEIFTLNAMEVLDRGNGVDADTGEMDYIHQLQATGIFADPNDFSVILVTAILGVIHFVLEAKTWFRKLPWLLISPVLLYAFALTKSRGGFLSLLAGLGTFLVARFGWKRAAKLGILVFPVLILAFTGRQTDIDLGDQNDTAYGRVLLWRDGLVLFKYSPIFGNGYNTYADEAGQVAHNSYIHAFAELGFCGGVMFLAAFLSPIFSCLKIKFGNTRANEPLAFTVCAMLVGYAVGIFSLSRFSSVATYLVLGIGCTFCAMGRAEGLPWMSFDQRFLGKASLAGVLLLIIATIFVHVVT